MEKENYIDIVFIAKTKNKTYLIENGKVKKIVKKNNELTTRTVPPSEDSFKVLSKTPKEMDKWHDKQQLKSVSDMENMKDLYPLILALESFSNWLTKEKKKSDLETIQMFETIFIENFQKSYERLKNKKNTDPFHKRRFKTIIEEVLSKNSFQLPETKEILKNIKEEVLTI